MAAGLLRVAQDISDRIVDLRKRALRLTQADLAVRAGVGKQQVSNWETGAQRPARSRLVSWADRERWPIAMFADGGPFPSEALATARSQTVLPGATDPLEVPQMGYLQEADGILRDTLRRMDAPYHVRVATAYAWLAARESRAPIPMTEIAGRLGRELGGDVSLESVRTILQVRPEEVTVIEALARVFHVDPGWLMFGPPIETPAQTE